MSISLSALVDKYPITGQLRNGLTYEFKNHNQLVLFTYLNFLDAGEINLEEDLVKVHFPGLQSALYFTGGWNDGAIDEVFFEEVYGQLNVKGKYVIDIGASIGDSAIYFALKKAMKVIAIEPFPQTYAKALLNIKRNDFGEVIELINAGISSDSKGIYLDRSKESTLGASALNASQVGEYVRTFTLDDVVRTLNSQEIAVKIDCEGCEYSILHLGDEVYDNIQEIVIEYHQGFQSLIAKLRKNGFEIERHGNSISGVIYGHKR